MHAESIGNRRSNSRDSSRIASQKGRDGVWQKLDADPSTSILHRGMTASTGAAAAASIYGGKAGMMVTGGGIGQADDNGMPEQHVFSRLYPSGRY